MNDKRKLNQKSVGYKILLPLFGILILLAGFWESDKSSQRLNEFESRRDNQTGYVLTWIKSEFPGVPVHVEYEEPASRITILGIENTEAQQGFANSLKEQCDKMLWGPFVLDFRSGSEQSPTGERNGVEDRPYSNHQLLFAQLIVPE